MRLTSKSTFFIIILFLYLGIVTYFFLSSYPQINIPLLHTQYSPYSKTKLTEFRKYLNPYSDTTKSFTTIQHSSNLESVSFYILNPYTPDERDNLISHFYKRGWSYRIYKNHIDLSKTGYLILYSGTHQNTTFTEIFISGKTIKSVPISSLFSLKSYPNIGSFPFSQNELLNTLYSFNTSPLSPITENGFNYYASNLKNIATFKNNRPIENITGFAILNTTNQGAITTLLNFYMDKFQGFGYIPFTVYGAIIDNNTIYYLKYGLGAATIEVKVVKGSANYSTVYFTIEVTASSTNNYLLQFQKQGWQKTFN